MNTVTLTDAVTGKTTELVLNKTLKVGQSFRLIGRDVAFTATRVYAHALCGLMVEGISHDMKYRTGARVADTAALPA